MRKSIEFGRKFQRQRKTKIQFCHVAFICPSSVKNRQWKNMKNTQTRHALNYWHICILLFQIAFIIRVTRPWKLLDTVIQYNSSFSLHSSFTSGHFQWQEWGRVPRQRRDLHRDLQSVGRENISEIFRWTSSQKTWRFEGSVWGDQLCGDSCSIACDCKWPVALQGYLCYRANGDQVMSELVKIKLQSQFSLGQSLI